MALNPFFLQGSKSEQNLVQQLINEQLRMYGVEVVYMPRQYISTNDIIRENILAKFDDNFAIEAYVSSYQGFGGAGDILTKFGVQAKDELNLIISKERYEDFISPFLIGDPDVILSTRPCEGDLIYFPLTDTIYEIKFVEHEVEFYQLNKVYVYELRCEVFEYEDEVINTGVEDIDDNFLSRGYSVKLTLVGIGSTATAITSLRSGSITDIYINNSGINYTSTPIVAITTSPTGGNASALAVMSKNTQTGKLYLSDVLITNPGYGYTQLPTIRFVGGGGTGIAVTAGISTQNSVGIVTITSGGTNYVNNPTVTFTGNVGTGISATANAYVTSGVVTSIILTNSGYGYTTAPTITIGSPAGIGTGNFTPLETVTGTSSSVTALVKNWDFDTKILHVSNLTGNFQVGEVIVGSASTLKYPGIGFTGSYVISKIETSHDLDAERSDKYAQNEEFENAGNLILDFTELNPFGEYGNMGDRF